MTTGEGSPPGLYWAQLGEGFVQRHSSRLFARRQFWTPMDALVAIEPDPDFNLRDILTSHAVYELLEKPSFPTVTVGFTYEGVRRRESPITRFTLPLQERQGGIIVFCKNRQPGEEVYLRSREMVRERANALYEKIGRTKAKYPPVVVSSITLR